MRLLLYLLICSLGTSCISLTAVQEFAAVSAESSKQFGEIDLTFQSLCQRKRQLRDLRNSRVLRTYLDSCQLQQEADSAVIKMQTVVQDYLAALYTLSSGERVYYDLNLAQDALSSSGLVTVETSTLSAYRSLLELLVTASTETYRRRQVEKVIAQANAPLITLIDQLRFVIHEAWEAAITQQKEMLYLNTRELADSAQTFGERHVVLLHYIEEAKHYEQQSQLLDTYVNVLDAIRDGHQQLYDQRNHLNRPEAVGSIAYYLTRIRKLHQSFQDITD